MRTLAAEARARVGVVGYWYSHLIMLAGIVLLAAALKEIVAEGAHAPLWSAWVLASGLACDLAGDVFSRAVLGLRPLAYRAGAALLAIAAGALGGLPELAGLALLMAATLALEQRRARV